MSNLHISAAFDSGNIDVVDATNPDDVHLRIRLDAGDEHLQWFHFQVAGARGRPLTLNIDNAGACSYPKGWEGYSACASVDRRHWRRVHTTYEDGVLTIHHTPEADLCWYAYFAPFSLEQHHDMLATCQANPLASIERLGMSIDGRAIDKVLIGEGTLQIWVIGRQHPGESMASWWMEGFLGRLLDPDDALARVLRDAATFHVVPHMNPDGSFRGHLRCNAVGANLNREWHEPSLERSPEVLHVRNAMDDSGVDLCLDVHGDEALPYNFIAGSEAIPSWTDRLAGLLDTFNTEYAKATPDFQTTYGYPVAPPGKANMTMCTNQVAERFDCLAMTLEMPFKDNADLPDPLYGWSAERCALLGRATLHPMAAVLDQLR